MSSHQQPYSMPFWDFIQSLDPNQGPGRGVDHSAPHPHPPPPPFTHFGAGFPFGGPGHHGTHPHPPPPPPGPHGEHPPPPYGAGFEWGPWFHGNMGGHMGGPWDRRGHRGRHGRRHRGAMNEGEPSGEDDWISASDTERDVNNNNNEKRDSPDTMRIDAPDPEEVTPEDDDAPPHHRFGWRGRRGGPGGRGCHGSRGGRGGRGGHGGPFGGRGGPHRGFGGFSGSPRSHHHHHRPHPYHGQGSPFDFGGFMRGYANHPLFRNIREHAQRFQDAYPENDNETFTPPVDVFDTERAFILHVSLPGAKKEDIDVNWDADRNLLNIAGIIHRPGDEEFLNTLTSSERKVGTFERNVTLPPDGSARPDEVDGSGITAKMEDGILVITVPKVEKEWTEIRKVDIQ